MKHIFTLSLCFLALSLSAQETITYPYNPDGDADGLVAVPDIQDLLAVYGSPFSPAEIMVGDSSLTYWVEQLSQTVQEQQEMIERLKNFSSLSRTLEYPQGRYSSEYIQFTCVGEDPYIVPNGKTLLIEEEEYYTPSLNPLSARVWLNGEPIETKFGGIDKHHFNAGDSLYFTGLDSVSCFAFLLPEDDGIDYVHVSLLDRETFTVPEGKTFLLRQARFYNPMFSGSYGNVEFSIDGDGWWTTLFNRFETWTNWFSATTETQLYESQILSDWNSFPAGTTISLENEIEQSEHTYFFLRGYLIDDDYFQTQLPNIEEEEEQAFPMTVTIGFDFTEFPDFLPLENAVELNSNVIVEAYNAGQYSRGILLLPSEDVPDGYVTRVVNTNFNGLGGYGIEVQPISPNSNSGYVKKGRVAVFVHVGGFWYPPANIN